MEKDNIIKLNFSIVDADEERTAKFEAFAKESVRLNIEKVTFTIETKRPGETVSYILDAYIDFILAGRYKTLSQEQLLHDIQNGRFMELRNIILDAFKADKLIKFHLEEEEGSHPELESHREQLKEQYEYAYQMEELARV